MPAGLGLELSLQPQGLQSHWEDSVSIPEEMPKAMVAAAKAAVVSRKVQSQHFSSTRNQRWGPAGVSVISLSCQCPQPSVIRTAPRESEISIPKAQFLEPDALPGPPDTEP